MKEAQAKPVEVTEEDIDRFLEDEKISSDYYGYILGKFHRSGGELSEEAVQGFLDENYEKKSSRNTALSVLRSLAEWKKGKIPPSGRGQPAEEVDSRQSCGDDRGDYGHGNREEGSDAQGAGR